MIYIKDAYPDSTVMEVQANNASSQGVVLLNPGTHFSLDDGLGVWACLKVVSERQEILRIWQNCWHSVKKRPLNASST